MDWLLWHVGLAATVLSAFLVLGLAGALALYVWGCVFREVGSQRRLTCLVRYWNARHEGPEVRGVNRGREILTAPPAEEVRP